MASAPPGASDDAADLAALLERVRQSICTLNQENSMQHLPDNALVITICERCWGTERLSHVGICDRCGSFVCDDCFTYVALPDGNPANSRHEDDEYDEDKTDDDEEVICIVCHEGSGD